MPTPLPNSLAFAASYVACLVLLGIVLTARVILIRRGEKVGIGDGGNRELAKRIRVHGNFSETAPFLAAILILLPLLGGKEWLIHAIGLPALTGRIMHAIGLGRTAGSSFGRVFGMVLTLLALGFGAIALLVLAWT
ncbi:MAG: MAPEG family protein [Rhizobiales bacterium]|nr:MAPEG family protein [Hyphomicrobiales bacterium]